MRRFLAGLKVGQLKRLDLIQRSYFLLVFILLAIFFALLVFNPLILLNISGEDGLIENVTAGVLIGAACLSISQFFIKSTDKKVFLVLSFVGIIGFLDEVSFGDRVFEGMYFFRVHGVKIDGIHDVAEVSANLIKTNIVYHTLGTLVALVMIFGILSYIFARRASSAKNNIMKVLEYCSDRKILGYWLIIFLCIFVSQSIDIFRIKIFAYQAIEESLELVAATGFMACLVSLARGDTRE
jgi:hypothetical protein